MPNSYTLDKDYLPNLIEKARRSEIEHWRDTMRKKLEYLELALADGPIIPGPIPRDYDDPLFLDEPVFKQIVAHDRKAAEWAEGVSVARQVKSARTLLGALEKVLKEKRPEPVPHR